MNDELGAEARELIRRALREEDERVDQAELDRIQQRILSGAVVASVLGASGRASALVAKNASVGVVAIFKAALIGASGAALVVGLSTVLEGRPPAKTSAKASAAEDRRAAPQLPPPASMKVEQEPPQVESAARDARAAPLHAAPLALPVEPTPRDGRSGRASVTTTAPLSAGTASPSAAPAPSLTEELAVLERVQAKLRAGDGGSALALLDANAPPPNGGQLAAERLAAEVLAACAAGEGARAQRAARAFLGAYPSAPASARVRASCAGKGVLR